MSTTTTPASPPVNRLASSNGNGKQAIVPEFRCPACAKAGKQTSFPNLTQLTAHMKDDHELGTLREIGQAGRILPTKAGLYICAECKAAGVRTVFHHANALGRHRRTGHGIAGTSTSTICYARQRGKKARRATPDAAAAVVEAPTAPRIKRKYATRQRAAASPVASSTAAAFCPCCGFDLRVLAMAMTMAHKLPR